MSMMDSVRSAAATPRDQPPRIHPAKLYLDKAYDFFANTNTTSVRPSFAPQRQMKGSEMKLFASDTIHPMTHEEHDTEQSIRDKIKAAAITRFKIADKRARAGGGGKNANPLGYADQLMWEIDHHGIGAPRPMAAGGTEGLGHLTTSEVQRFDAST